MCSLNEKKSANETLYVGVDWLAICTNCLILFVFVECVFALVSTCHIMNFMLFHLVRFTLVVSMEYGRHWTHSARLFHNVLKRDLDKCCTEWTHVECKIRTILFFKTSAEYFIYLNIFLLTVFIAINIKLWIKLLWWVWRMYINVYILNAWNELVRSVGAILLIFSQFNASTFPSSRPFCWTLNSMTHLERSKFHLHGNHMLEHFCGISRSYEHIDICLEHWLWFNWFWLNWFWLNCYWRWD